MEGIEGGPPIHMDLNFYLNGKDARIHGQGHSIGKCYNRMGEKGSWLSGINRTKKGHRKQS